MPRLCLERVPVHRGLADSRGKTGLFGQICASNEHAIRRSGRFNPNLTAHCPPLRNQQPCLEPLLHEEFCPLWRRYSGRIRVLSLDLGSRCSVHSFACQPTLANVREEPTLLGRHLFGKPGRGQANARGTRGVTRISSVSCAH
jgi:hypothetical protein